MKRVILTIEFYGKIRQVNFHKKVADSENVNKVLKHIL